MDTLLNDPTPTISAVIGGVVTLLSFFGFTKLSSRITNKDARQARAGQLAAKAMRSWLIERGFSKEQAMSFTWGQIEQYVANMNSGWPNE